MFCTRLQSSAFPFIKGGRIACRSFATTKIPRHYLHLAPDGDAWINGEMYAAKHLNPNYVVSLPLRKPFDVDEDFTELDRRRTYDGKALPSEFAEFIWRDHGGDNGDDDDDDDDSTK